MTEKGGEVIVRLPHCDYLSYRVMVWLIVLRGAETLSKTLSKTVSILPRDILFSSSTST